MPDNNPTSLDILQEPIPDRIEECWEQFLGKAKDASVELIQDGYSSDELKLVVTPTYHGDEESLYMQIKGRIIERETGNQLWPKDA